MVKGLASCGIFVDNPKVKKLLRNLVPAYSGFVCLLDSSGNVFGKEGNIPEHINSFSIQTLLEQSGKSQSILQLGEQTYRYRLKEIKNANFYVLVAVSDSVLKGMLMALAEEVITLNLLSFLLALLVSIILANLLVQPINKLVEGLREVGKGNYAYAIKARSFGEMEEAINSFNDMTEKLQKNRMIEKLWDEQWKSGDSSE
jgi:methyl-accepting chemotaxis protein